MAPAAAPVWPPSSGRPVSALRLRPPRHAGAVPGMWHDRFRQHNGMKRRLLNLLTALSLLMCVAVCVLWARSYLVGDFVAWERVRSEGEAGLRTRAEWSVITGRGGLLVERVTRFESPAPLGLPVGVPPDVVAKLLAASASSPQRGARWQTVSPPTPTGGGSHLPGFWQRRGFD